jgi:hypothetical protein
VNVGASFPADAQAAVLVEPAESAFDDPALAPESRAVLGLAARDQWQHASLADEAAVVVVVVAAVADDRGGSSPRSADLPAQRRHRVDQRHQLRDIVAVAAGQADRERDPVRVRQEVVLTARAAAVDRAGTGLEPPFSARTWLESTTARDQSISPAACRRTSSSSCSDDQTPASCQSLSRRQQVMPEPKPSACGRCSQPIPVCSTNRMPLKTRRSSSGRRPGYRNRRGRLGINGSINSHSSSETNHGSRTGTPTL